MGPLGGQERREDDAWPTGRPEELETLGKPHDAPEKAKLSEAAADTSLRQLVERVCVIIGDEARSRRRVPWMGGSRVVLAA